MMPVSILAQKKGMACVMPSNDLIDNEHEILQEDLYLKFSLTLKTITPSMAFIKEEEGMLKVGALTKLEDLLRTVL
jgi:hypothetical protein